LGQGLPGRLSMAKSSEAKKAGATQQRPQQRSQSGLRPGWSSGEGSSISSSRGMRGFFPEVGRPRSDQIRARTRGQRLTLVLVADKEQVARLVGSAGDWNRWRAKNPKTRPDLRGADLRHTDLRRTDLRRADLSGSNLSQANLSEARLGRADLTRAVLIEADLIGADLSRAVLDRAAVIGTYLLGANLRGADLNVTDLRGADLRGADLRGADLTHSFFLIQAQIETALGDLDTKLPPSLTRPAHWAG